MTVIERKVIAFAVVFGALVLTIAILPVSLLGTSFAPAVAIVVAPVLSVATACSVDCFQPQTGYSSAPLKGRYSAPWLH